MAIELDKQQIMQHMDESSLAGGLHLFDAIDSTNAWALAQLGHDTAAPFACLAEQQSQGRGRRGKQWLSPPNANIYMSLAWRFTLPVSKLGALSLMQGVAVIQALRMAGVKHASLKWPNDVLVDGDKIAGILIETTGITRESCSAVIGVGLNYCMPDDAVMEASLHWTDVCSASGNVPVSREQMAGLLLNQCIAMCKRYQHQHAVLVGKYRHELESLMNRTLWVETDAGEQLSGRALGVTESGELRMLIDGREQLFNSANVSLHGLPGE